VEPPLVIAFQLGATTDLTASPLYAEASNAGVARLTRSTPSRSQISSRGLARSIIACSSWRGRRAETGLGVAPSFQRPKVISKKARLFGRARVTRSPAFVLAGI
jgi:hypothetical protein